MCIRDRYYPSTGDKDDRGIAIETKVELYNEKTGKYETPFNGAEGIDFERVYTDDGKPTKDNQGNEIRPSQIEDPTRGWISSYFEDPTGYEMDPYYFYLKKLSLIHIWCYICCNHVKGSVVVAQCRCKDTLTCFCIY